MSGRRERKDAIEHRRLILQTAQSLFNEHGVHSVSMHQIAKTAGVGQATLYRRFAHKGDLCNELLLDFSQNLTERFRTYLEDNAQLKPEERLSGLISISIDAIEEKADLILAMESNIRCEDPRGNMFHSVIYRTLRDQISGLLTEILGPEPGRTDTTLMAHAIICSLDPQGFIHLKHEMGYTSEQIKQCYDQMFRLSAR